MNEVAIQLVDVSKRYGHKIVLNALHYEVLQGRIYGFIGPSGSGKTTLIKMIVGMDTPDEGNVTLLQTPMPNLAVLQRVGYMAQSDALYTALTGRENLAFFAAMFQLKKKDIDARIAYAAQLVNLTNDLNKRVSVYSGGMKRRLSLAIALIQDPDVLILDEPTVGIDPALRVTIWEELLRLKETGKTIVVTTHVMDEAERCDEVALLRDGQFIASGSPQHLKHTYNVESLTDVFLHVGGEHA